jgi:hypothetical protein
MIAWVKHTLQVLGFLICLPAALQAQTWVTVATDAAGDGSSPSHLDATKFEYAFQNIPDSLYFRLTLANISASQAINFGANVMIHLPGQGTFNFWGNANTTEWTKLVTIKASGTPPSAYTGTIGVANSIGVNQQNFTNLSSNNIKIVVDTIANTIVLGMDRKDLISNSDMSGKNTITLKAAAAVGTSSSWNDDVYDTAGVLTLNQVQTGLYVKKTPNSQNQLKIYPNPATTQVFIELNEEMQGCGVGITNALGEAVYVATTTINNTVVVNTQQLAAGIYFANVHTSTGNVYRQRFAVVK